MGMPFGKFKGYEIGEVEPQYLEWLAKNIPLRGPLRTAVFEAIDAMSCVGEVDLPTTKKVKQTYRELSMKYHPDRGGNKEAQQTSVFSDKVTWGLSGSAGLCPGMGSPFPPMGRGAPLKNERR